MLLQKLSKDMEYTDAELDGISKMLAAAAERQIEKDALCASLAAGIGSQHEQLAMVKAQLAESLAMRAKEAELAHSAQAGKQSLEQVRGDLEAQLRQARDELEAERCRLSALQGANQAARERLESVSEQARADLQAERDAHEAKNRTLLAEAEQAMAETRSAHERRVEELTAAHAAEIAELRRSLAAREDELSALRASSDAAAQRAAQEMMTQAKASSTKDTEIRALGHSLSELRAEYDAVLGRLGCAEEASKAAEARYVALERANQAQATQAAQEKALALGARLKNEKLAADARREAERAAAAERALLEAQQRADELSVNVLRAESGGTQLVNEARDASERAEAERKRAEARAQRLKTDLDAARKMCDAARDECVKVRRRCERAESELSALKERFGVTDEDTGGPGSGLGEIFDNLSEMETMVLADSKKAERRLRERAKRANAREVVERMDETGVGVE